MRKPLIDSAFLPIYQGLLGADDEIRTRDPHLGKVMLYQLSHVRSDRQITKLPAGPDNT